MTSIRVSSDDPPLAGPEEETEVPEFLRDGPREHARSSTRRPALKSRVRSSRIRGALATGIIAAGIILSIAPWVVAARIGRIVRGRVYDRTAAVPERPVAIVFGAGLWPDGSLTPVLADRVATGVDLYRTGKVQRLLFSGDNRRVDYNEPEAMRVYAVELGVPEEHIVLDYAGRRTWDTIYRARAIFAVERAVVVTQRFHLPRVLYLCDALGVDAVGVVADRRTYSRSRWYWEVREYLALMAAWWDVNVRQPVPVLGQPLPIEVE